MECQSLVRITHYVQNILTLSKLRWHSRLTVREKGRKGKRRKREKERKKEKSHFRDVNFTLLAFFPRSENPQQKLRPALHSFGSP